MSLADKVEQKLSNINAKNSIGLDEKTRDTLSLAKKYSFIEEEVFSIPHQTRYNLRSYASTIKA